MDNLLEINSLNYSYGDHLIFNHLQFSIKKGTLSLILGPNSCGKTTLIRLLTGILVSDNNISINSITLNRKNLKKYMTLFGAVFFDNNYNFLTTNVIDELSFPLENLAVKKEQITDRIYEIRNILKLHDCINKNISELSYFEKVKVLIGAAIIHKPKIVFLDNLFCGLNNIEAEELLSILEQIKTDTAIVITSSNLDYILEFDDVIVLGNQKVLFHDNPIDILKNDNELTKNNLIIPPMIDLSLKLEFYGVLDKIVTDVDGMVRTLWK